MKTNKQQGFTLIELIMVIVILGILAAIALPKFFTLGADARIASVNAAKGSLNSVSAMAHAKFLVTTPSPASTVAEGQTITFVNGYPKADAGLQGAAGLNATDYDVTTAAGPPGTLTVSPKNAADAANCKVVYTEATDSTTPPTMVVTATQAGCS